MFDLGHAQFLLAWSPMLSLIRTAGGEYGDISPSPGISYSLTAQSAIPEEGNMSPVFTDNGPDEDFILYLSFFVIFQFFLHDVGHFVLFYFCLPMLTGQYSIT